MNEKRQGRPLSEIVKQTFAGVTDEELVRLRRGVPPWDSVGHIALMEALERETSVQIDVGFSIRVRDWASLQDEMSVQRRR